MPKCSGCGHQFEAERMVNGREFKSCPACRAKSREGRRRKAREDPAAVVAYQREHRLSARRAALDAYGGVCECCREGTSVFLLIDGPGVTDEVGKELTWGRRLPEWLARQSFPPGYKVLCHNCRYALASEGQCPHAVSR